MVAIAEHGYLLGIGSNLAPDDNIGHIVHHLLSQFDTMIVSSVLRIPPVGMESEHDFLNLVAYIPTPWPQSELKAFCNQVEIQLGRDRTDPNSHIKDRPADLDILAAITDIYHYHTPTAAITDEAFLHPLLAELLAYIHHKPRPLNTPGIMIKGRGLTFGKTATTIYR